MRDSALLALNVAPFFPHMVTHRRPPRIGLGHTTASPYEQHARVEKGVPILERKRAEFHDQKTALYSRPVFRSQVVNL